jgi:predicted CoA-binding protein
MARSHVEATTLREAATEFLSQPRLAVAGVSRDTKQPANLIYRRLRQAGHEVFAINPNAESVEGDRAYASVAELPDRPDGVVVVTTAEATERVVEDCISAGVPRVWLHRGIGPGSVSEIAIARCRESGTSVIRGGCPNMFGATSDAGHRCMRAMLSAGGKIPSRLPEGDYPLAVPAVQAESRGS